MVTYFNRKDLVSFGSYLLSEKRKARFLEKYENAIKEGATPEFIEDHSSQVWHADIENWMDEKRKDISDI